MEGKKARVRTEVRFNRFEKVIIFIGGLVITLADIGSSSAIVTGDPVGIAIGSLILLAFFVFVSWYVATVAAMLVARRKGTIVMEGF